MSKYRHRLPQLSAAERLFMTDGGMETTLIFHNGLTLPHFAAFDLLRTEEGTEHLRNYYAGYAQMAVERGTGAILESATWRANADWAALLHYDTVALADANRRAIGLLLEIRAAFETRQSPMVISGALGPRGDGYKAERLMSVEEARDYHAEQIATFAQTDADMVAAFTINYLEEAVGIALAAREHAMPAAISFTLETDGCLPSGISLETAIAQTDAATDGYPAYYMINCAHPTHFEHVLANETVRQRLRGLRANSSRRSHAELDESTELDEGNPVELGQQYAALHKLLPKLAVAGGCCGTDERHVHAIFASI